MAEKVKIVISDAGEEFRELLEQIARDGLPDNCEVIYRGPRNLLATLREGTVNVKQFGSPCFPNNFVYGNLRKSKARRSYEHALQLLRLGFATPLPYGYIEVYSRSPLGIRHISRSYYVCRHLQQPNMRFWEGNPDLPALVDQWGAEIARLHKAGVWMKDHSAGNVLLGRDAEGHFTFSYVDLNRIRFGVTSQHLLLQMFKSVSTSAHFTLLLARAYARAANKDERKTVTTVKKIYNKFNHTRKKHRQ